MLRHAGAQHRLSEGLGQVLYAVGAGPHGAILVVGAIRMVKHIGPIFEVLTLYFKYVNHIPIGMANIGIYSYSSLFNNQYWSFLITE